jgi:hypothetical protein
MANSGIDTVQQDLYLARVDFPETVKLLGSSQKVKKGESIGVLTAVMYLAPHRTAQLVGVDVNLCEFASRGCMSCCLGCMSPRLRLHVASFAHVGGT